MKEYNDIIDKYKLPLMKWSFRDIDKIIKRIFENIRNKNFKNFKYFHFIYFYLLSPIPNHYYGKTYENKNRNLVAADLLLAGKRRHYLS